MLTLQLFSGAQELPGIFEADLSSQEGIDEYLTKSIGIIYPLGEITPNGVDFVRRCLMHDSEKRLTARQAFRHIWLQTPKEDRELFQRMEVESTAGWEPRGVMLPVIEDLTEQSFAIEETTPRVANGNAVSRHFCP